MLGRRAGAIGLFFGCVACEVASFLLRDGGPPLGAPPVAQGLVLATLCVGLPRTPAGRVAGAGIALGWLAMAAFDLGVLADWAPLAVVAIFAFAPGYLPAVLTDGAVLRAPGPLLWGLALVALAMAASRAEDRATRWALLFAALPLVVRVQEMFTWANASV